MVPNQDIKCKLCNNITSLPYPVCSGIEDKPFGSEMRYGRGVCDTDPIPIHKIRKSCRIEDSNSVTAATISIDHVTLNGYFKDEQQPFVLEQHDLQSEKEIEKQFLKDPTTYIPFEFSTLVSSMNQDQTKFSSEESEQKSKKKRSSSDGFSKPDSPDISMASLRSPRECDHLVKVSKPPYKELAKQNLRGKDIKPAGPFTEPPNPGKQMKLGEPYYVRDRVKKDFYKDF